MTEMEFKLHTKTVHYTHITNLELVPAEDKTWEGLVLQRNAHADLTEEEFEANWLGTVIGHAIELLPMYEELDGAHIYLGHFGDGTQCAIAGSEMDNFGKDVTYNGWRVLVSCNEVGRELD